MIDERPPSRDAAAATARGLLDDREPVRSARRDSSAGGTGEATRVLDARGGRDGGGVAGMLEGLAVTGLAVSRERLLDRVTPGVDPVQGDVDALPFGDGSFDAVVSLGSLVTGGDGNRRAAAEEFARVLRRDGFLLLSVDDDGATDAGDDLSAAGFDVLDAWSGARADEGETAEADLLAIPE